MNNAIRTLKHLKGFDLGVDSEREAAGEARSFPKEYGLGGDSLCTYSRSRPAVVVVNVCNLRMLWAVWYASAGNVSELRGGYQDMRRSRDCGNCESRSFELFVIHWGC